VSRRALLGGLGSLASALALGGCASLGATGARFDASSLSVDPTLLVTTTRKPVTGGRAKPWFGPERASTGTMLTLESLRQLYARYGDTVAGRIGAVVFAAPDIDMDVFSSAINRIGPLAGKITVIAATNDRALALSGRIAGGMTRVGAAEKAAIEQLGVRVILPRQAGVSSTTNCSYRMRRCSG
jgi:esterase/lipase superfamily enzyme